MRAITGVIVGALLVAAAAAGEPAAAPSTPAPGEIHGLESFGGSETARRKLLENGFVVTDETYRQICSFYTHRSPPFITTDALLYAYYLNLEKALDALERKRAEELPQILEEARKRLARLRAEEVEPLLRKEGFDRAWEKAIADAAEFLQVARVLAEGKTAETDMAQASKKVQAEVALILAAGGRQTSPLCGIPLDYSRFRPRGLYVKSGALRNFHRAVTWLYEVPFRVENEDESRQAAVLSNVLDFGGFGDMALAYQSFLGPSDETGMADWYCSVSRRWPMFADDWLRRDPWPEAWKEMRKIPAPRHSTILTMEAVLNPASFRGLRVLARPSLYDNDVLAPLAPAGLVRPPLSGEELMALMGSAAARDIVMAREGKRISGYARHFEKAVAEVPTAEKRFDSRLCRAQRELYRTLMEEPKDTSLPAYYLNRAWRYKDLNTCLAGWAHYRYIWDLHGKRAASCGGLMVGDAGAVEPNPAFFERLLELTVFTDSFFVAQGVKHGPFADLETMLIDVRGVLKDQLAKRPFTKIQVEFLSDFGPRLANVCGFEGNAYLFDEELPDTPFCVPVAVDVVLGLQRVVGQGRPRAIYVIDERDGKRRLLVGGVLAYQDGVAPWQGQGAAPPEEGAAREPTRLLQPPAWQEEFAATFTRGELLAQLRAGKVTPVMDRHADLAMGGVLAELLARDDSFSTETDGSGLSPRDSAVLLFGLTGHPKVAQVLLPKLEKATQAYHPHSWYTWPEARALRGNLTEEHAALLEKWIDGDHPCSRHFLGLLATIPGEKVEAMLLGYLDRDADQMARIRIRRGSDWSGGPPSYFFDSDFETVLNGLLERPGVAVSRKLAERLERYTGEPLRLLVEELESRWSGARLCGSNDTGIPGPSSKEEEDFVRGLAPRLEAAAKRLPESDR